ncbi:hypothetical protein D3C84_917540 [compost metagenome]
MKTKLSAMIALVLMVVVMAGCGDVSESQKRYAKDQQSEWGGGLQRKLTVYSSTGEPIAQYEGKFDIDSETADGGKVKFDLGGKRVIIYNATVITEEQ